MKRIYERASEGFSLRTNLILQKVFTVATIILVGTIMLQLYSSAMTFSLALLNKNEIITSRYSAQLDDSLAKEARSRLSDFMKSGDKFRLEVEDEDKILIASTDNEFIKNQTSVYMTPDKKIGVASYNDGYGKIYTVVMIEQK